jgi:hypothetical protein
MMRQRASKAFTPKFRAALADACQREFHRIGACYCPQAALMQRCRNPSAEVVEIWCRRNGFKSCARVMRHHDFQQAFDFGYDFATPESALGLCYRQRFVRDQ